MKNAKNGERVNWLKLRWIQVRREEPRSLFVNYSFDETSFQEIKVQSSTRGRPTQEMDGISFAYSSKLRISSQKKKDLVNLCDKGIIPQEFHSYYSSLQVSSAKKDKIPSPGSDEESDDTDSD